MSDIKKLKSLLEGAKIVSVSESKNPESLCNFCVELDDERTSFTLYATDLGYWVGDIIRGGRYENMTDMLGSVYNHVFWCQKTIRHINECDIMNLMGYFECDCGEMFIISEENVGVDYRSILKDDKSMGRLAGLLSDGTFICGPNGLLSEFKSGRGN